MGGQPPPTISWFSSLLLTPSDFNSRSTASSCAPFRVNSTSTASIPNNQDRNEGNHVVGSTNNNVLNLPKFFDDDCQLWFSTIELLFRLQGVTQQNVKRQSVLAYCGCRQSKLSWLRQFLNHMIQSNLCLCCGSSSESLDSPSNNIDSDVKAVSCQLAQYLLSHGLFG